MFKVNNIKLINYRNFNSCEITFGERCNVLFGHNGSGKTNIIEAISLIGKGRGIRNDKLINLIKYKEKNFEIHSNIQKNEIIYQTLVTSKKINDTLKKITSLNNEISSEATSFIYSSLSFIIFLPEMERLFLSSPNKRRDFLDKLIFSENKNYNQIVNKYKRYIQERTKILQSYKYDHQWIAEIEKNISFLGLEIYKLRNKKINDLEDELKKINKVSTFNNNIEFELHDEYFKCSLNHQKYLDLLKNNRDYDKKFGGSKVGPHKSDINVFFDNKLHASQLSTGQQKTLVLLILIAQCNYLIFKKNFRPVLLLDEICSHLDDSNRELLLDLSERFDIQMFMTGTHKSLFSFISTKANFYNITDL